MEENAKTGLQKATAKMFPRNLGPAVPIAQPQDQSRMSREERAAMMQNSGVAAVAQSQEKKEEKDMVGLHFRVPRETRRKLRKLAADREVDQQDLIQESLELLFKKYGR